MFAEELAGNAGRKKAEENRERRRRLKEQQQKKTAAAAKPSVGAVVSSSSVVSSPSSALTSNNDVDIGGTTKQTSSVPSLSAPKEFAAAPSQQLTAVEKAEQQRLLRAELALQTKATTTIQSFYKSVVSNRRARVEMETLLSKRLSDLSTLSNMVKLKGKELVPPPATTTSLAQMLLFVTTNVPYKRRESAQNGGVTVQTSPAQVVLLERLLSLCIIPSTKASDDNMNVLLGWIQSAEGRLRFERLLRLALVAIVSPSLSVPSLQAIAMFVRLVLSQDSKTSSQQRLSLFCRSLLLENAIVVRFDPPASSAPNDYVPWSDKDAPLDLFGVVRYYLLFMVAGRRPIPDNAKDLREKCVPADNRNKAGELLLLLQDVVEGTSSEKKRQLLRIRFLTDIYTIPLLTWKVSSLAVTRLMSGNEGTTKNVMLQILNNLVDVHGETLASGRFDHLLSCEDVPLTVCPATGSQCLLANLYQLCLVCPAINGTNPNELDFSSAALFFNVVASLVDIIPVGTFSSRDSSVAWVTDGKGHHTPIVLSAVILDQCKLILLDSFVRRLFNGSIDVDALRVEESLALKNEKDLKYEKDLLEAGTSAATLAAKEARVDRSKSFWNSSKWAKKITKGVTSLLTGDGDKPTTSNNNVGEEALMNTSSISRKLAVGSHDVKMVTNAPESNSVPRSNNYDRALLFALCRVYGTVLARWGGGGQDVLVGRSVKPSATEVASAKAEACVFPLLNVLAFSTSLIRTSWAILQADKSLSKELNSIIEGEDGSTPVRELSIRPRYTNSLKKSSADEGDCASLLFICVSALSHALVVTDDVEIYDMDRPLPIHQLRRCIQTLKKLLYRTCCTDERQLSATFFGSALVSASSRTMRDLYDRSSRRPLCVPKLWLVDDLLEKEIRQCKSHGNYVALLSLPVLRVCPFLVSFKRRLKLFERIVTTSRISIQGVNDANPFNTNPLQAGIPVRITRGRLLEDGLATMNNLGSNMRQRIAVQYYNEAGVRETGIDVGGLFKEFWTDLCAIAFDPNYALFRVTDGAGNCMYPNPSSGAAHGSEHIMLFEFLGRILGKALYEGITIQPRFAHFFLSFLRGDYNYLHMLPDLSTVDPQLYNNLMFLKTFDGDAADLCLTFTVTNDEFGDNKEIPLIPNGGEIEVTNANKHRYIGLVAKYYVVDRVKEQSEAFTRGLWEVIDRQWLRIFNEPELQVLISGASDGKLDVADMKAHTRYVGGYTSLDRNISRFWHVVASFDGKQQADLLRFVTSCERPPPLGFASLNPPFTIQRIGVVRDDGKLPTASTCFNVLKLPTYSSEKVLRERLLYAIQSGAGFELS